MWVSEETRLSISQLLWKEATPALNGFPGNNCYTISFVPIHNTWHASSDATLEQVHILVIVKASLRRIVLYKCCSNRVSKWRWDSERKGPFCSLHFFFCPVLHFFSSLHTLSFTLLAAHCIDVESLRLSTCEGPCFSCLLCGYCRSASSLMVWIC